MNNIWTILDYIKQFVEFIAIFGITLEISPSKINPIQWLGKRMNKNINDRIDSLQEQINNMEYQNAMKDLRNIKTKIHGYAMLISKGEILSREVLENALEDLDIYDYYKEKYVYMYVNGNKVKINGEMVLDKKLIENQLMNLKK